MSGKKTKHINTQPMPAVMAAPSAPGLLPLVSFKWQAILLAVVGLCFYANTFTHEYAYDDRMTITANEYVQQGLAGLNDILTKDTYQSYLEKKGGGNQLSGGRYRPLSVITFAVEQQLLGLNNGEGAAAREQKLVSDMHFRHVVNVLLYILTAIVLLYFLRRVLFPDSPLVAFLSAFIFIVLPVHSEVVTNVKSRDEILSLLFICLTFINAFAYREHKKTASLALAICCYFLALMSKEYAITLLILLPLSFYLLAKESLRDSLKSFLPYLAPVGIYLLLRLSSVSPPIDDAAGNVLNNPYLLATTGQTIATEFFVLLKYLRLLAFPSIMAADYSYNQIPYTSFTDVLVWLSIAIHITIVAVMFVLLKQKNVIAFAVAFYLLNLVLISNFFFNIGAPMGDRLIFHSSVGFSIIVAYLLHTLLTGIKSAQASRATLIAALSVILILSGYKTIARNSDWKNDETLFLSDVQKVPNSAKVNNNAAAACMIEAKAHKNEVALRDQWFQKAIAYYTRSLSIYARQPQTLLNRGLCHFNMGNPDLALPDWDSARKYSPAQPNLADYLSTAGKYFFNKGLNYLRENKADSAIMAYKKCAEATPEVPGAWYNLATAYKAAGDIPNARSSLEKALKLAPNYGEATYLMQQINGKDSQGK